LPALVAACQLLKLAGSNKSVSIRDCSGSYYSTSCQLEYEFWSDGITAVAALCNLAGAHELNVKLVEQGAVPVLVKILSDSNCPLIGTPPPPQAQTPPPFCPSLKIIAMKFLHAWMYHSIYVGLLSGFLAA